METSGPGAVDVESPSAALRCLQLWAQWATSAPPVHSTLRPSSWTPHAGLSTAQETRSPRDARYVNDGGAGSGVSPCMPRVLPGILRAQRGW